MENLRGNGKKTIFSRTEAKLLDHTNSVCHESSSNNQSSIGIENARTTISPVCF